jgi:hypothetical protein
MERWVEHRRPGWEERSPGQPDATLARIRNHITPHVGDVALDRLRPVDVDNLYSVWRAGGMAESTVRRMHAILHSALTQAVRWDLIVSNPADRIVPPRPRKARRQAPADDVLVAIIAAAGDHMVCYLRLAAVTGARRGQMVALRWRHLDLDEGTVTFTTALARVKGGTAEKGTKADLDYGLALDPKTVDILRAHRKRCVERALAAGGGLSDDAYVFTRAETPDGSKPWHPGRGEPAVQPDPGQGAQRREDHAPPVPPLDGDVHVRRRLRPGDGRRPRRLVIAGCAHQRLRPLPTRSGPGRRREPRPPFGWGRLSEGCLANASGPQRGMGRCWRRARLALRFGT